jgi:hypothetical protein
MSVLILFVAGFVLFAISLVDWRMTFLGVILVGFLQDPLRKSVPDEPVYFVVLCTAAMALALMGAMIKHGVVSIQPIAGGDNATRRLLRVVIAVVAIQGVLSWVRYGSPIIAAIGLLSYLSPIPAVWLAYHYARAPRDIRRFLGLYITAAVAVACGIYLAKLGFESPLFRQVGAGLVLYDPTIGVLETFPGFMRSPEVAAWHVGASSCILIALAVGHPSRLWRLVTPWAVPFLLTASILTGRRKVLVIVASFLAVYFAILYYFRHRAGKKSLIAVCVPGVAAVAVALAIMPAGASFRPYIDRGQTVFGGVGERFTDLGLASVGWAIYRGGFLGLGAGAGSQGTQHFFEGGAVIAGGAAEGGLGKVAVELGIPGLILVSWALILVARNVWRVLRLIARQDEKLLPLCAGMVAFCAANIPVFIGASQIYGDPFVLMMLGSFLGFVLASPRLCRPANVRA